MFSLLRIIADNMSPLQHWTDPHRFDLLPTSTGAILDVGCGSAKFPGAVGMDISSETEADIVHDLDLFPYPIDDDSFDEILAQDVIEHVAEPIRMFDEFHRIAKTGAKIQLRTPHFSSVLAYGDPTHRHYFSTIAIRSFAEPRFAHYTRARFRVTSIKLDLWLPFRALGIGALANRFPDVYEKYFAFWFPTMNIRATLEVIE